MNATASTIMNDVLQLTKAGRLAEAMALLKRGAAPREPQEAQRSVRAGLRGIVDMVRPARKGGTWTADFDWAAAPPAPAAEDGSAKVSAGDARPGSFAFRTLQNAAGSRRYKLYIPNGPLDGPMPLVVMLHGCTQSPDDFATGTHMNAIADELRFLVAYPEQRQSANSSKCWNWFKPGDQRRDGGEPSIIADIVRQIMRELPVDPKRVFVAGLSAGGAAAAIMGHEYPDLFAGVGVHSGLACGSARDLPSALTAMRAGAPGQPSRKPVPTIVFHGTADHTVSPLNASNVLEQAAPDLRAGEVVHGTSDGGVSYTRTSFRHEQGAPAELWMLAGAGHAWSGGSATGSYTDPRGPDASREMMRFFLSLGGGPN